MNGNRVKIVLILCLVLVDAVLAAFCVRIYRENHYLSEEEAALAVSYLAQKGVTVEPGALETRKYDLPVYTLAFSQDSAEGTLTQKTYRALTNAFFSVSVPATDYIVTPEGVTVSVMDGDGEVLGASSLIDGMTVECERGASLSDAQKAAIASGTGLAEPKKNADRRAEKQATAFVRSCIPVSGAPYTLKGSCAYADGTVVTFVRQVEKTDIYDLYLNLYLHEGEIRYLYGDLVAEAPQASYSVRTIDAADAACLLPKDEPIRVTGVRMVYKRIPYAVDAWYLIPSWYIAYTDESGESFVSIRDAVTGSEAQ